MKYLDFQYNFLPIEELLKERLWTPQNIIVVMI